MNLLVQVNKNGLPPELASLISQLSDVISNSPTEVRGLIYPTAADKALGCYNERVDLRTLAPLERIFAKQLAERFNGLTTYECVGEIAHMLREIPKTDSARKSDAITALQNVIAQAQYAIDNIENDGELEDTNVFLAQARNNIDLTAHIQDMNVETQQLALLINKASSIYYDTEQAIIAQNYYKERGVVSDIKTVSDSRNNVAYILVSTGSAQQTNYGYDVVLANTILPKPNKYDLVKIGRKG